MTPNTLSFLVVDDDHIARFLHKKVIETQKNINIIYNEAISALTAIQILNDIHLRNEPMPDFILLDINMPIMDGFGFVEVFQKLDFDKSKTQILAITSSENEIDKRRCFALGVKKYISKPLTVRILESLITERLSRTINVSKHEN